MEQKQLNGVLFGVPETFIVYKNKIIKKFIGPLDKNSVKEIKKIIK